MDDVALSGGVASVNDDTFRSYAGLADVAVPNDMASVNLTTFYGYAGLADVAVPSDIAAVSLRTFGGYSDLADVAVPTDMASVNPCIFSNYADLGSVDCSNADRDIVSTLSNCIPALIAFSCNSGIPRTGQVVGIFIGANKALATPAALPAISNCRFGN